MRPLSLTVAGFRSYRAEHTFALAERRLVGVVGPIGSGKSTILDAVSFALYGKTPTVGRDTKSLINQQAAAAHVELWFEADGENWRAVRALRRSGQSEHALYRHAEPTEMSERLAVVTGDRAVTERVTEILGLGFPAFQRSVLLAQNQFSAFLKATPGERDDVLRGVFGFDRVAVMQAAAKRRADGAQRDLAELERIRGEVAADQAALDEAGTRRETALGRLGELEAVRPEFAATLAAGHDAAIRHEAAAARVDAVAAMERSLPAAEAGDLEEAQDAEDAHRAAAATVAAVGKAAAKAEAKLAAVEERFGPRDSLAEAQLAAQRLADRQDAEKEAIATHRAALADGKASAAAAEKAAATATAAEEAASAARVTQEQAQDERSRADEAYHAAEHGEMAATLRGDLTSGEQCPVCEQSVTTIPRRRRPAGLATADKARASAARAEATAAGKAAAAVEVSVAAGRERATACERAAAAERAAEAALSRLEAARNGTGEALSDLVALAGEERPQRRVAEWQRRLAEADAAIEAVRAEAAEAATASAAARDRREAARRGVDKLGRALAAAAARLGAEVDVTPDPRSVSAGLAEVAALWKAAMAEAEQAAAAAAGEMSAAATKRDELLATVGLPKNSSLDEALVEAGKALAAVEAQIEILTTRVARVAELEAQNADAVRRLATYRRLAADLAPAKFLRYLLDEERARLAQLGSERFELLSGGRYRFSAEGDFRVVDLYAADATRSADSLSGGETFLASLSLALALADMVTREGGRLDAFFLDEGFGSLDAEHLDLAMEGIERLVSESASRLVVVVSHVPEMRERIEDLIELDRDPATGATHVKRS